MAQRPMHFDDRMSEADALMWAIESDPFLRSTINSVWVLDRAPDWERFDRKLERCAREIPRLRQRVVSDPLGLAAPRWEIDPDFDVKFHVRRIAAPGDGSERALLDLAQPIGMQAFDRDRPLWELYCVEGLEGGRVGMIMKLHHAVSDGVGLVRMTEGLVERKREADRRESAPLPEAPKATPISDTDRLWNALTDRARARVEQLGSLPGLVGAGLGKLANDPAGTRCASSRKRRRRSAACWHPSPSRSPPSCAGAHSRCSTTRSPFPSPS